MLYIRLLSQRGAKSGKNIGVVFPCVVQSNESYWIIGEMCFQLENVLHYMCIEVVFRDLEYRFDSSTPMAKYANFPAFGEYGPDKSQWRYSFKIVDLAWSRFVCGFVPCALLNAQT